MFPSIPCTLGQEKDVGGFPRRHYFPQRLGEETAGGLTTKHQFFYAAFYIRLRSSLQQSLSEKVPTNARKNPNVLKSRAGGLSIKYTMTMTYIEGEELMISNSSGHRRAWEAMNKQFVARQ
jgi:hypothetical protein